MVKPEQISVHAAVAIVPVVVVGVVAAVAIVPDVVIAVVAPVASNQPIDRF